MDMGYTALIFNSYIKFITNSLVKQGKGTLFEGFVIVSPKWEMHDWKSCYDPVFKNIMSGQTTENWGIGIIVSNI